MRLLVLYRAECPETTAALSAPCPASYSTPSPHLLLRTLHPTSPYLYLCPSTSPRVRLRVRAVSRPSARRQLINIPNALPYRIRVPFFTVLYWPRPASSAPALFILVVRIPKSSPTRGAAEDCSEEYVRVLPRNCNPSSTVQLPTSRTTATFQYNLHLRTNWDVLDTSRHLSL